ncbi:MAG: acetyltransferase [Frondihabitans sp.]|nr:acetyltransferase [Frondihabitans sp.]
MIMEKVELRTERLTLRAPHDGDVAAITAACQDPELQARVPIPVPYGVQDALDYVHDYCENGWLTGRIATWAVETDGAFAGVIGVEIKGEGRGEIGFWMAPEFRGQGLLPEAGREVVSFAFEPDPAGLGLLRLTWRAFGGNVASARVAQKLGFRFEGVARLGASGRQGLEDDWLAGLLSTDDRAPVAWPILRPTGRRHAEGRPRH